LCTRGGLGLCLNEWPATAVIVQQSYSTHRAPSGPLLPAHFCGELCCMRMVMVPGAKEGCGLVMTNRGAAAGLGGGAAAAGKVPAKERSGQLDHGCHWGEMEAGSMAAQRANHLALTLMLVQCHHSPWNSRVPALGAADEGANGRAAAVASAASIWAAVAAAPAALLGLPKYCDRAGGRGACVCRPATNKLALGQLVRPPSSGRLQRPAAISSAPAYPRDHGLQARKLLGGLGHGLLA